MMVIRGKKQRESENISPANRALFEVSSISEGMHSSLSTQATAPLPRVPETPRHLPSEVERIAQMPFPPEQYSPQPTSVIPHEAVINISTHDVQYEQGVVSKISLEGLSIGRYHINITYQNFKLSNFLVQMQGKQRNILRIFLTDFATTQNKTFLVKAPDVFPYMAPECWYGQSLPASDQYGLAAITYELLTGRVIFQGQSEQIMHQLHLHMQPQPLKLFAPHLSPRLSNVVLRALSKKAEDRFPSIMDFAHALQQENT